MSVCRKVSILSLLAIAGLSSLVTGQAQRECECVEYYLCDQRNGTIITDGTNLLDIRTTCPGVQVCCVLPNEGETNVPDPVTVTPSTENTPVTPDNPVTPPNTEGLQVPNVTPGGGCGRRRFPPDIGTGLKVTGGDSDVPETTFYGEAPWMVVILQRTQGKLIFKCGGTLILPNVVLTAAHCVKNSLVSDLSVRAGEYDNRSANKPIPSQTRQVDRVVSHPDFNSGNLHNDIALVFLKEGMELNKVVDVICGPEQGVEVIENDCFVTGWGRNAENGTYQAVLSKVSLPLRKREYCVEKLRTSRLGIRFRLHEGFICAGGDDKRDTCRGDGGGPLTCPTKADPNKMMQMGIVAWGIGCGEGFPTVFTSVTHFLPWVQSQLS